MAFLKIGAKVAFLVGFKKQSFIFYKNLWIKFIPTKEASSKSEK